MPSPDSALAAELAHLRGDFGNFGRDFGEIKTSCAVLVERSTRTEQDVRDLRADVDTEINSLRSELEDLKRNRWPWASIGVLARVAGAATGVIALLR
ncbi:hypothetical protein [Streptomyces sp. NPDC059479]|uniref:hypothetical protein n=1 Tax=Streptomyces sp. NPDC059479 TaxID=3346848 RepID=UPI003684B393